MLKVLAGCFLVVVAGLAWVAWFLYSVGRQPKGPPEGLDAPLDHDEVRKHRPRTEQDLRALALGPNTARIVELYRRGRLARGAFFERAAEETRVSRNTTSTRFYTRYGWYDAEGRLQERVSDDPDGGLLNESFTPMRREFTFLVAYDPGSKDHVIFYEDGGVRLAAPPALPIDVPAPPAAPARVAPDLSRLEPVLRAAPAQFDDLEALHVLSDRLAELGSPLGEFMALQLSRAAGQPPPPREHELLGQHGASWLPPGTELWRSTFERGFPVQTVLIGPTHPGHPGWQTIQELELQAAMPSFSPGSLPRLRALSCDLPLWLPPDLAAIGARLEVLHVRRLDAPGIEELLDRALALPLLHTLELQGAQIRDTTEVLAAVLRRPFPALRRLWLAEPMGALQPVRDLLEAAPRPLTVCLSMDFGLNLPRSEPGVWLELEPGGVARLHQRGAPDRNALTRARALLASVGVDGGRIYT